MRCCNNNNDAIPVDCEENHDDDDDDQIDDDDDNENFIPCPRGLVALDVACIPNMCEPEVIVSIINKKSSLSATASSSLSAA